MAIKTRKTAKATVLDGVTILPELRPADPGWGSEPLVLEQPGSDSERRGLLVRSLAWYSANFARKNAKDWVLHYAAERGVASADLKVLRGVHERQYDLQLGAVARLAGRGLELNQDELARIGDHLKSLLIAKIETVEVVATDAEPKTARPNVQDIMRERTRDAAGELEGLFDDYVTAGCPQPVSVNVVGLLTERSIMTQHVGHITEVWTKRKAEYEAVQAGDKTLVEGYSQYTKMGMRNLIKWCDAVLAGLASYSTVKKASKAPRKKKAVPVEKQVAKVKYLKTWTDETLKLELTSVHPAKLVGASECFVYDTAKRRLTHYIADSHAGSLGVRGTTLIGFDATKSLTRTLRKPGVTLPALMKAGKPAARKVFAELTTVGTQPNGRINENTVILRVS